MEVWCIRKETQCIPNDCYCTVSGSDCVKCENNSWKKGFKYGKKLRCE